jgi:hypothetical protein
VVKGFVDEFLIENKVKTEIMIIEGEKIKQPQIIEKTLSDCLTITSSYLTNHEKIRMEIDCPDDEYEPECPQIDPMMTDLKTEY